MKDRIKIDKQVNKITIAIKAYCEEKKQQMLLIWIILFSICGIIIFTQFFEPYDSGTKVFFGVYIAFWLFFEFKVIYAYRWRKYGEEKIIIEKDELLLIKTIGKRGITQKIKLEEIVKIDFFEDSTGKFVKSMNTSYWNINKYHLMLKLENSVVPFAIDIENKDAKRIITELNNFK